ncbi:TonB-dependent receptor [Novosphingobium sp.]|uniref:TonB-dependent receptor n=1 Tax=Novosphingobium sp. TaxID=1874826 RepID=UPI002FE161D9
MPFREPSPFPLALRLGGAGALALALALSAQAHAETATEAAGDEAPATAADAASDAGGNTILVTAQKRTQSVQDVPASVVALGGDALRDRLITRASDISRFVPSFSADTSVGNLTPRWYLRGIGNSVPGNGQTSPVGIYQDEVYLGIPVAQGFPIFDLERVEVLSGPQGTLWGKNTTAGAVNFISRRPAFDASGYARAEYGSYGSTLLEGAWGGPLNDMVAVRFAGHFRDDDGFATNRHDGTPMGKNREAAARFSVLAKPTDTFEALLRVQYRDYKNVGDIIYQGVNATDSAGFAVPQGYRNNSSFGNSGQDLRQRGVQLNLDWDVGDLHLTSISGYNEFKHRSELGTQVDHEGTHTYSSLDAKVFSQELRLASPDEGRLKWILGAHYYYEKLDSEAATAVLPNTVGLRTAWTNTQFSQSNNSYGLFANVTYEPIDNLEIILGGRYTWEDKAIDLDTIGTATGGTGTLTYLDTVAFWSRNSVTGTGIATRSAQDTKRNWRAFTYDATAKYNFTRDLNVYARYAKGFRSGGFNTGATVQTQVATVDPEYVKSYEIGLKSEWFGGRLSANLAAFYNDYSDIQVTVIQLPLSQLSNAGKGWSKGIEGVLSARPVDALHLTGTLGLLDTKYTEFPNCKASVDCSGNQFVRAPHVTASIAGDYTFELGNGHRIVAETNWSYRSHLYFNAGTQTAPLEQGPKWLGNVALSWKLPSDIKLSVFARNLTNSHAASTIIPSANFGYIKYIIEPRVWGGAVSVTF